MKYLAFAFNLIIAVLWCQQVTAVPITWNIEGGTFSDGGTLNGSFTYDYDDTNLVGSITDWSITVTGGDTAIFSEFTYDTSNSTAKRFLSIAASSAGLEAMLWFESDLANPFGRTRELRITPLLALDGSLTTVGLTPASLLPTDIVSSGAEECYQCSPFRSVTGGNFVMASVPEPSSLALLGIGLLIVVASRGRNSMGRLRA